MSFAGLNYLAVVLAAVGSFLFGGIWYGVLSQPWMSVANLKLEDIQGQGPATVTYVITFIAQLIMAWVLAGLIGHLGPGSVTLYNGLISAAFIWVGFVVTTILVNHRFQLQKPMLTVIDSGHWLGVLMIQGAVIGLMGV
jgi:hypothetical protein